MLLIMISGIAISLITLGMPSYSPSQWTTLFALTGSVLLLNHYYILLPPKENSLSMDSAVFLASLFLFGLEFTLHVLALHTIIFAFTDKRSKWWVHALNYSFYIIMMTSAYIVFLATGGEIGSARLDDLIPYVTSLSIYFIMNVLLIGTYFLLSSSGNPVTVIKGIVRETLATYLSTLLLSLVLMILLHSQNMFGLFLFLCIAFLLSQTFKHHFDLYKAVEDRANRDFLTGLNNHGYYKELLDKELSRTRRAGDPLCVAILDLDDFKKYNDQYGHIKGDQILREFGLLLKQAAEGNGFTVARYGGEEFSLILPRTASKQAYQFLDHLRQKTNKTYYPGVESLLYGCLSFSAGIAEWEEGMLNTANFLNKADIALYSAKNQGKNLVKIYQEEDEDSSSRQSPENLDEAEKQLKIFINKDIHTYRHSKRVYQYAIDFADELDLPVGERKALALGALIHDIGKIEIPLDVLSNGRERMKKQLIWEKDIISIDQELENLIPLIELHYERYDGKGRPYGLKGSEIPKLSRIFCIIDSFDEMTSERNDQKKQTMEEAIEELRACSGKQFDPELVDAFISMIKKKHAEHDRSPRKTVDTDQVSGLTLTSK